MNHMCIFLANISSLQLTFDDGTNIW